MAGREKGLEVFFFFWMNTGDGPLVSAAFSSNVRVRVRITRGRDNYKEVLISLFKSVWVKSVVSFLLLQRTKKKSRENTHTRYALYNIKHFIRPPGARPSLYIVIRRRRQISCCNGWFQRAYGLQWPYRQSRSSSILFAQINISLSISLAVTDGPSVSHAYVLGLSPVANLSVVHSAGLGWVYRILLWFNSPGDMWPQR